jgi:hypothetical protein
MTSAFAETIYIECKINLFSSSLDDGVKREKNSIDILNITIFDDLQKVLIRYPDYKSINSDSLPLIVLKSTSEIGQIIFRNFSKENYELNKEIKHIISANIDDEVIIGKSVFDYKTKEKDYTSSSLALTRLEINRLTGNIDLTISERTFGYTTDENLEKFLIGKGIKPRRESKIFDQSAIGNCTMLSKEKKKF